MADLDGLADAVAAWRAHPTAMAWAVVAGRVRRAHGDGATVAQVADALGMDEAQTATVLR